MMIEEATRLSGHAAVHNILTSCLINLIAQQFQMSLHSDSVSSMKIMANISIQHSATTFTLQV